MNFKMVKRALISPLSILIITLALISTWYVLNRVILPNVSVRIQFSDNILSGQMEPPYQYRVLLPYITNLLQILISPLIHSAGKQHVLAYSTILFLIFLGIYYLFYKFLRNFFTRKTAIIGILLLQAVIPLSVTGYFIEGDFIALFFYLLGFNIIIQRKDVLLPVVIGIATFNREQIVFLIVFYVIYLISQQKIFDRKKILIVAVCFSVFLSVFFGTRLFYGFKPTQYTIGLHIAYNTDVGKLILSIIPLWFAEVVGLTILCTFAFRRSNLFFKLSFLSLGSYTALFFVKGNMWELAKFLPAFIILIPMSLQILCGEFVNETLDESSNVS